MTRLARSLKVVPLKGIPDERGRYRNYVGARPNYKSSAEFVTFGLTLLEWVA